MQLEITIVILLILIIGYSIGYKVGIFGGIIGVVGIMIALLFMTPLGKALEPMFSSLVDRIYQDKEMGYKMPTIQAIVKLGLAKITSFITLFASTGIAGYFVNKRIFNIYRLSKLEKAFGGIVGMIISIIFIWLGIYFVSVLTDNGIINNTLANALSINKLAVFINQLNMVR